MTSKHQAGVLSIEKLKAFTPRGKELVPIQLTELGISYSGLKKTLAYALSNTRNLGIRLNVWQSIEIDLVEQHPKHQLVDVNFINNGLATHRVLSIKVFNNNPISFLSVSVHPTGKKEIKNV